MPSPRTRRRRRRGSALLIVFVLVSVMALYSMRNGMQLIYLRHFLSDVEARQERALDRLAKARYGGEAEVVRTRRPAPKPRTKGPPPAAEADP